MSQSKKTVFRNRLILTTILVTTGLAAIGFLSVNVAKNLRILNSATSDNVQWTLSQTEVEFLEFEIRLDASVRIPDPDLRTLRREFDIFYSRVTTLSDASIYAPLRDVPEFARTLTIIQSFLDDTVPVIDATDPQLTAALADMSVAAANVRPNVRQLSNSGLEYFARESDRQRGNLFRTLTQMAAGVTVLLLALLLFSVYLGRLNRQNIRRRQQAIQAGQRLNIITSTALDAVVVCDLEGRVLDFNAAAEQIFGYRAAEAMGKNMGALIVPDHHRAAHDAGMKRMRESGEKRVVGKGRFKMDAMRATGEVFPVELAIQSAQTADGEIFISFLRDISHRVAAEKALVEARDRALSGEKAKSDFLATMSHEIRSTVYWATSACCAIPDYLRNRPATSRTWTPPASC